MMMLLVSLLTQEIIVGVINMEVIIYSYNNPAITIPVEKLEYVDSGDNILKVKLKDGTIYYGYHIKVQ